MQTALSAEALDREVVILGINRVGSESGNDQICAGRDLPWLQDSDQQAVWVSWGVSWRDVVVVDGETRIAAVFNLTEHDLSVPELRLARIDPRNVAQDW